jgi:hypothetical protein
MKIFHFIVFTLLAYTLISCNKNSDNSGEEPDNTPLLLIKKISRYEINGQITADSIAYKYDPAGHLIATLDAKTNQPTRTFIYDGDNLITLIDYVNGKADTLKNPITIRDGGNTIFLDHTRPNPTGGMDTIQITYKWAGNQLLESWTYLHLANPAIHNLQKTIISYNSSGNEFENTVIFNDGSSNLQYRALAYDQKKNYFNSIPRLNYIFGQWGFPYATRSVNNPVKAEMANGTQEEYIWTYNKNDYPTSMQVKGKNYLALELQYNK